MIEIDKSSKMMLCTFYYLYILWLKQTYKKIKFELQGLIGKSQKSKMQMKTFHRAQKEKYLSCITLPLPSPIGHNYFVQPELIDLIVDNATWFDLCILLGHFM